MKLISKIAALLLTQTSMSAIAQNLYTHDRVYTANQVSNSVSVVDPAQNKFLGEIKLGRPYPGVLNPLYKGEVLVHGMRYSQDKKMLAVVSIGSNSVTLISTDSNKILKTIYIGRSPHEPTFTTDSRQIWVSVRGEAYISVIDTKQMTEVKRIPVADGPGMVSFTTDGKLAYVCSSFTPEVDIINTNTYSIVKRITVTSPFSPNIFSSPNGDWIALTHKDVGKVTILNTKTMSVEKVISTGAITNHVIFSNVNKKLLMMVTIGGENLVRVFDAGQDFKQIDSISVGGLPHGLWASSDGKRMYVGLEYGDMVQPVNLETMEALSPVKIGQSPQALVYADNAVTDPDNVINLTPLNDETATQVVNMYPITKAMGGRGRLAIRSIGLTDLVEQIFTGLKSGVPYTLALTRSATTPFIADYEINSFEADPNGKYNGQSYGLVKTITDTTGIQSYKHIFLFENKTHQTVLLDDLK